MINCVIIDDEPFALELLENYVNRVDFLNLKAAFTNSFQALNYLLENHDIDLLFLDINMPELSGLDILNSLRKHPSVIFTTAYSEYAVQSYEYEAVDYLLKPISYQRFIKAVTKVYKYNNSATDTIETPTVSNEKTDAATEFIYIKSSTQIHKLELEHILFIEGAGNYWSFQMNDKKILTLNTYAEVAKLLPENKFIRIHKSFIVPLSKIDIIEKHQVTIGNHKIPIGLTYREHFTNTINHLKRENHSL